MFWLKYRLTNQNGDKNELLERWVYIIQLRAIDQPFMLFIFNFKFT